MAPGNEWPTSGAGAPASGWAPADSCIWVSRSRRHILKPPYRLEIELEGLPQLQSGVWGHWAKRRKHDQVWKDRVKLAIMREKRPTRPLAKAHIVITRCSTTEPDFDNLAAAAKPLVDALIGTVLKDDSPSHLTRHYQWEKAPRGQGSVKLVVTETR